MSWNWRIYAAAFVLVASNAGISHAQSPPPRDSWLMQNYRFTGPPPPGSVRPTDPVVSELQRIQNAVVSIMHRAKSDEDYETALAAAAQATANAQAIGAITEHLEASAAKANAEAQSNTQSQTYLIAFQDHTVEMATSYWTDGRMLHYLTRQGAHVQVRLDLVDRSLSARLNRELNLEFRLPE
jgi:hypothetical protein